MTTLAVIDLSFSELLVVAFVALIVFGGELPQAMRKAGRAYAKLRRSLSEVTKPVREEVQAFRRELDVDTTPKRPWQATPVVPPYDPAALPAGANEPGARERRDAPALPTPRPSRPSVALDEPPPV